MIQLPTGTVTFLFTDIEGSTRRWEQQPRAMAAAVARHEAIVSQAIQGQGGYVFKALGDAFCAAFDDATHALEAAVAAERALLAEDWARFGAGPAGEPPAASAAMAVEVQPLVRGASEDGEDQGNAFGPLLVRMAIHTGAAEERDNDYFGPPLNRVARLLAAGHGGQVLLSQAAEQLVRDPLPEGLSLRSLGERRLKDLQRSESVYQVVAAGLPTDFPPLRTLEAHANNLPVQLTSFVGRERELASLLPLVEGNRLVTISGPGGGGKTRLALQVAADLIERFSDGVWWVNLEPINDPELVAQTVADSLGVQEEPGRPMLSTLADYLAPRTILLVIDNCEHLLDAIARLVSHLLARSRGLKVLATSRSALGVGGELLWPLAPLTVPALPKGKTVDAGKLAELAQNDAVRLFVDRATTAQSAFRLTAQNASALVDVCRRLEGIPLALELCAARIKVLSLEQLCARLDDRLRLLTGGSRTASARQQTLRATIDWSHELLTEPERVLFRRLAVFRGGCSLEAAEAVCADEVLDVLDVLDLVSQLVDKSLLRTDEGETGNRYRMLDSIREYALERLAAAGETEAVNQRLLSWGARLTADAESGSRGSEQALWLQRLEADHDNLRMMLNWVLHGPGTAGERPATSSAQADSQAMLLRSDDVLMDGLSIGANLWPFWQQRGHLAEGRERLDALLGAPGAAAHPDLLVRLHNGAGVLATRQGDYASARFHFEAGLALAASPASVAAKAELLTNLGTLHYEQSDFAASRRTYEEALAAWRALGDQWGTARALNNLGLVAMSAGQADAARQYYEEALAILHRLGHQTGVSFAQSNLGILALWQGDYATARTLITKSLETQRALGHRPRIASSLGLLGLVAYYERDLSAARAHFAESLELEEALGNQRGVADVLRDQARVELAEGDAAAAEATMRKCVLLHRELGKNISMPEALEGAAFVAYHQANYPRAGRLLAAAETQRAEAGLPVDVDAVMEHESAVQAVRQALGAQVEAVWDAGRRLDWQAALGLALGEDAD